MKCVLHIGTEKTGTTSVQHFLFENRLKLKEKGFVLLDSIRQPDNRFLALAAVDPSARDRLTRKVLKIKSDEELISLQKEIIVKLKNEVSALPKDSITLISNEHLQSRLRTEKEVLRLKSILEEVGYTTFQVIVYLRDPGDTVCSLYSTILKGGSNRAHFPSPDELNINNICDHQKTLERFSKVFKRQNLKVRLFRKDFLINKSVVHDICHLIGLDLKKNEFAIPHMRNKSLSYLGIQLLIRLNQKYPMLENVGFSKDRHIIISYLEEHYSSPAFTFPLEHYMLFDKSFEASNKWVLDNYFPNEKYLFQPTREPLSVPAYSKEDLDKIVDEILNICKLQNTKTEGSKQINPFLAGRKVYAKVTGYFHKLFGG